VGDVSRFVRGDSNYSPFLPGGLDNDNELIAF